MEKKLFILFTFLVFAFPVDGQKKNYNCVILDSIFGAIHLKKAQNDFLLPLIKSGQIKTDGDSIYRISKNRTEVRKIDSVLSRMNVKYKNLFLNDSLFSLDTFNIIVDTFNFFDNSCSSHGDKDEQYVIINEYNIREVFQNARNVIIVEMMGYNSRGAFSIVLRNTKSNYGVVFGIRESSVLYPSVSIIGKYLYDPEHGLILE